MKQIKKIIIFIWIVFFYCGPSIQLIEEPVDDGNLIIGSLVLDINGYQDNYLTIKENIDLAIVGRVYKRGKFRNVSFWAVTDEQGYFYVANVPEGEYAIKGFRLGLMGAEDMVVVNELNDPQRNFYELREQDVIPLSGNLLDTKSQHRIINFEHNIFTIFPNGIVRFERHDQLSNFNLLTGETINRPLTEIYFMDKFENSCWTKYLQMSIN